jgi:uncharacterized membrane protein YkoI
MRAPLLASLVGAISLAGCCCDPCAPRRCPPPCPAPCAPPCAAPAALAVPPCGAVVATPACGSRLVVGAGEAGAREGALQLRIGEGGAFTIQGGNVRVVQGAPAGGAGQGMVIVIEEGKEGPGGEEKEGEKKADAASLPPEVRKALEALLPGATLKEVETGTRDGQPIYEVEVVVSGKTTEVVLDGSGKALQWEIGIDPAAAPKGVIEAAQAAAKGKVTGVAEIRGADKELREYQVDLKDGETEYEVHVSPDGKVSKVDRDED